MESYQPNSREDWRNWLQLNHAVKQFTWVIFLKQQNPPRFIYKDAVDEALCFGWIDSKAQTIDKNYYQVYFCKRKRGSPWSRVNKQKIIRLENEGLMTDAGRQVIENAKADGSWTLIDDVEDLIIPPDLLKAFRKFKGSKKYFDALSRTNKRNILQWIQLAKKDDTRQRRIMETAELAAQGMRPKPFN